MKSIIYLRTSTEEQNPENQLKDCESINNYGEYNLFEEKQSAWKDKDRFQFEEIRKLIKNRQLKHLIVWDLDRIYRKRIKIVEFLKFCKIYGCNVHSFRQTWLEEIYKIPHPWNEIVSDMLIQIMGWMAEEESNKKSDRVKRAIRKDNGITQSYRGKKWGRKSLPEKVVREITTLYNDGESVPNICKQVHYWDGNNNKRFVKRSTVYKILKENKSIIDSNRTI